jgi:hypothetical protein
MVSNRPTANEALWREAKGLVAWSQATLPRFRNCHNRRPFTLNRTNCML